MPDIPNNQPFTDDEHRFMRRALALAARGRGSVEPNPMVGCVLVRDGQVVAEGYHRKYGGPHAEIDALQRAGEAARGATAYVTLEPCCHVGKTGPCTEALIAAGVSRVVAAMTDPFPKVACRGMEALTAAGIDTAAGLCEHEAHRLNAPYLKRLATGRPWVILKWAQSLDGKLASHSGHSQWITGPPARAEAHRIRGRVDAVIVGVGTVVADDPALTCRLARPRRTAKRVVVDGRLRIPPAAQLVRLAGEAPVLIVCTQEALRDQADKADALRRAGCEILALPAVAPGRIDPADLLGALSTAGATNVMIEGGGHLLGGFLDRRLADEVAVFVAPMLIGGAAPQAPPVRIADQGSGEPPAAVTPWPGGVDRLDDAPRLRDVRVRRLGDDLYIQAMLPWAFQEGPERPA